MSTNRWWTRILFLSLVWAAALLVVNTAAAQQPKVEPGTTIEYLDIRGQVKKGEFVEMVGTTMVRVKQEDGTTRVMPGNRVRLPGGANKPAAAPAGGAPTAPATQPAANAENPFEAAASSSRKWTDSTGKFTIDAEFISLTDNQVQLKKTDGKFLTLPLEKLSSADQEVAKSLAKKKAPAEPENPFEANVSDKPAVAGTSAAGAKEAKTTLAGVPNVTLDAPAAWAAKVDSPAAAPPALSNRSAAIPPRAELGDRGRPNDFFERADSMIVDANHNWLWVGVRNEPPGGQKSCRLERIDLVKGTVLPPVALPTIMKPLAVDPTGRYLATVREDDFHNRAKQLDLFEIDGEQVRPTQTFKPYERGDGKSNTVNSVKWAEFVDGSHLLTLSDNGTLVLWDLATLKANYLIELGGWSHTCALSPGRKQLAVATSSGVYLLEPLSGNVQGKCEMKDGGSANLMIYRIAFSQSGEQLAGVGPLNLWVWNVADGKNTNHFSGTTIPIGHEASLAFGASKHLILDHRYAFDIERGLMTCHYSGSWSAAAAHAGRHWYLTETGTPAGKSRSVMNFALPGNDVVAKAATIKEDELLAIKPGSRISLELNLPFEAAEMDKIRESATKLLTGNGWVVAAPGEASDFTLTANAMAGESKEISYRMFGRGFANTTVTVTYQHGEMTLTAPGVEKPVWQTKATWGPPSFIHLKEGQTIEDATRTAPNASFFANPAIPRRLMKYPNGLSIVSATLSPQGVTVQ